MVTKLEKLKKEFAQINEELEKCPIVKSMVMSIEILINTGEEFESSDKFVNDIYTSIKKIILQKKEIEAEIERLTSISIRTKEALAYKKIREN